MRVETHNKLQSPTSIEATRVLVRDQYGNPILAAIEGAAGEISIMTVGDPNFEDLLAHFGLLATEVVPATAPPLPRHR